MVSVCLDERRSKGVPAQAAGHSKYCGTGKSTTPAVGALPPTAGIDPIDPIQRYPFSVDTQFAYAASIWWDVVGDYGRGYADLGWHECPAIRVGHSFTHAGGEQRPNYQVGQDGILTRLQWQIAF